MRRQAPRPGVQALRAAVAQARHAELGRAARAGLVQQDVLDTGPGPSGRATGRSGRLAPAGLPVQGQRSPASPDDPGPEAEDAADEPPPGDVADSLELVRRVQAGDVAAFGELYDRYNGMVYRYLAYRVPSRQVAEDLTSDTFLRALRSIHSWTWQGRDVGAWFVTIARNLVADHYKSSRYRLEIATDDVSQLGPVPLEDGPEGAVLDGLDAEVLLAAVRRLSPEQQECVSLRFLQGLSVAETAGVMGKTDGAVKALQHRAVRSLARLLPSA